MIVIDTRTCPLDGWTRILGMMIRHGYSDRQSGLAPKQRPTGNQLVAWLSIHRQVKIVNIEERQVHDLREAYLHGWRFAEHQEDVRLGIGK